MLRNWFREPRWKRYAAQSGYLYEYIFEGVEEDARDRVEYAFRAIAANEPEIAIRITLANSVLAQWSRAHRELTEIDRFGIAKMALLQAFDACSAPEELRAPVQVSVEQVEAICAELDF